MKRIIFTLTLVISFFAVVKAEPIFKDINFDDGTWAMVGVPLHNYQKLPIQEEMGTFICEDIAFMKEVQKSWALEYTNEDKCDYHYSLKLYKNGDIEQTVMINLYCGYLTSDGLSYSFNPALFSRFKAVSKPVSWSRISFQDSEVAIKSITKLDRAKGVYWYEDINPYLFKGSLGMAFNNIPYDANRDSLKKSIEATIRTQTGSADFYLVERGYTMPEYDNGMLYISYTLNCNENIAKKLEKNPNVTFGWKPHLNKGEPIRVVAIGVDEKRYKSLIEN